MSPRQRELYNFLAQYAADHNGGSPSYSEISEALSMKSKSTVHEMLERLEAQGKIKRNPGVQRSITVIAFELGIASDEQLIAELESRGYQIADSEGVEL